MKKIFLVCIAMIGFTFYSQAQDLKFGVKGGVNFANINFDSDLVDPDSKTGYHIGFVAQASLAGTLAIQPELLYSAQGADDFDIDYLNVPILLKYKLANILSFEAGPQFGFVVNDDFDDTVFDGDINEFDVSGAVGAGVEFGEFFAQLRYNFGLTDVSEAFEGKNSNFQISVGYYIF